MKDKRFWIQMATFLVFSLFLPLSYIFFRFKLYKVEKTITFWTILMALIVVIVFSVMIKYYLDGTKLKFSYGRQLLMGLIKVIIPLGFTLFIVVTIKDKMDVIAKNIDVAIEVLSIILGCETIAIVVNPLPKWKIENNIDGISSIADKIFKITKGE